MSFGDEIMASGHAKAEACYVGGPVHICDVNGKPRWSDLWGGLMWISSPHQKAAGAVKNGPGCRPYIRYPFNLETGCRYSGWRASENVGAIALTASEVGFAYQTRLEPLGFVVIEPDIAADGNPNKQWGRANWAALVGLLPEVHFVQLLAPGRQAFHPRVTVLETPTFRHAAAVLSLARAAVLPEGGLHHAAAALGVPAVVLFGGSPSVAATGYPMHVNLGDESERGGCGAWRPCDHCAAWWASLKPVRIAAALRGLCRITAANAVRVPNSAEGACA